MLRSPGMCSGTYGFNMALESQTIRRPRPPASFFSENSCLPSIESFRITISPSSYFRRPSWFRNLRSISAVSCHSTAEISIKEPILVVKDLTAVISETKRPILKGVNLTIYEGEVHAVMGKNGSGKSTFSKVLAGHPDYEVTGGSVVFKGMDMLGTDPEYRSLAGLFTSFQSPVEIPGVTNVDFLNMAYNARRRDRGEPELGPIEFYGYVRERLVSVNMRPEFLNRNVNEGFSGGEKKRNEILQLAVLGAELAILDEIDSGLDVDALRDVANAVKGLFTPKTAALFITHYFRLLECVQPALVHIMDDGKIVRTSDMSVARGLEKEGYRSIIPS